MKIIFIFLFSIVSLVHAKITPPNYDFNWGVIENFFPSKTIEDIKKINLKIETLEDNGDLKLLKTKLIKKDYSLDIYLQLKKDVIFDTYIRMPQYFSHDIFLKELQSKWKKQDKFKNKDGSSYYVWFNRDNMNILYQGSCSITCFPMFIEFVKYGEKGTPPLYKKFNDNLFPVSLEPLTSK